MRKKTSSSHLDRIRLVPLQLLRLPRNSHQILNRGNREIIINSGPDNPRPDQEARNRSRGIYFRRIYHWFLPFSQKQSRRKKKCRCRQLYCHKRKGSFHLSFSHLKKRQRKSFRRLFFLPEILLLKRSSRRLFFRRTSRQRKSFHP